MQCRKILAVVFLQVIGLETSSACPCYRVSVGFLSSRDLASSRESPEPDWQEVQRAVSHQHLHHPSADAAAASLPARVCLGESRLSGCAGAGACVARNAHDSFSSPWQLFLPDGVTVEVVVAHQVDAGHMFLQQHTHPTFHVLRSLDQQMFACYSQPEIPTLPTPVEGKSWMLVY